MLSVFADSSLTTFMEGITNVKVILFKVLMLLDVLGLITVFVNSK